jgi:hypothetical protein
MLLFNETCYAVLIRLEDALYARTGVPLPITRNGWAPVELE